MDKETKRVDDRLTEAIRNLRNDLTEIRAFKLPNNIENHVTSLQTQVDGLVASVAMLTAKLKAVLGDPKTIREIDDNNIIQLFIESGVHLKQIADEFKVSVQMAAKYAKGDIQDKKLRHDLAKFFQFRILENNEAR